MTNSTGEFKSQHYSFEPGIHREKDIIWIRFPYDPGLIAHLKLHTRCHWSRTHKKWYVPDVKHYREIFGMVSKFYSTKTYEKLFPDNRHSLLRYIEHLQLKGYSDNTIRTYSGELIQLLITLNEKPIDDLDEEKLRSYLLYCVQKLKLSENTLHSRINAIKFYFEQVAGREKMFFNIPRPKKRSSLPKALSTREIKKMFQFTQNNKHRLLLKLCYGMGLRVSEVVRLRVTDVDRDRMQVLVRQGKGKKDRYTILPESILEDLRAYYREYKPGEYLFEGQRGGPYSIRSVQQVFKNAMKKAGIRKKVGVHSLRHSYATHLIEQGTDIRFVQDLLGHKNIKTTMIYTHLTDPVRRKIKSPLDRL